MDIDFEASFRRIDAIIGDEEDAEKAARLWLAHLRGHLALPCDVIAVEDFRWEERYVLGVGDPDEYKRLRRRQPSCHDVFVLQAVEADAGESEWAIHREDLGARVIRKGDGKEFLLGLSELVAIDHERNAQLLQDYSIWRGNYV